MCTINDDYGIKYKVIKISDDTYILLPIDLVEGYCSGTVFYTEEEYKVLCSEADLHSDVVVTNVYSKDELLDVYGLDELDFVKDYFVSEQKDKAKLVRIKDGKISSKSIDIRAFLSDKPVETYERQKNKPAVTLNETALEHLLNIEQIDALKAELQRYHNLLSSFRDKEKKQAVTRLVVTDGHVSEVHTNTHVKDENQNNDKDMKRFPGGKAMYSSASSPEETAELGKDISLQGLETYMKERVFGHDDEIRSIAKTILMNYTAQPEAGEKNESILLIGPTGTGKTETVKAVIDYLDVPLLEVNAANLVPQGIKGMSLEDCLYSLIVSSGYDVEKAQRGLVFFDEFDKLGEADYDSKTAVIQILLKFIEGDTFMIDKSTGDYNFDTSMLIKIFAGAFSNLFTQNKTVGFGSRSQESNFDLRTITESQYFGKELVTRIPHIYVYHELDKEMQKNVLLRSKISAFLLKKQRYQRQFGVTLQADDSYIEAILNALSSHEKSMRDLNNLVVKSLDEAEYEMLSHPTGYKRLVLTRDTVNDNKKFDLS